MRSTCSLAAWTMIALSLSTPLHLGATPSQAQPEPKKAIPVPELGPFVSGMDPMWHPWIKTGQMPKGFFHVTLLRPSLLPKRDTYGTRTGRNGAVGITLVGKSTRDVLVHSLRLPTPAHLVNQSQIDLESKWDVVFSRSKGWTLELAWNEIQKTMCEVAGIKTEAFRGETNVLVPNAEGTRLLRHEEVDWLRDPGAGSLRSLSSLLTLYEGKVGIPIEKAGWQSKLYLDTRGVEIWSFSADDFRKWLASWDVRFSPDRREMELIRVVANP